MCMVDDADFWELLTDSQRKARKEHRCDECGRVIQRGETYRYMAGIGDGHFDVNKACAHCCAAQEWLRHWCSGWLFGAVREDLEEHWQENWEIRDRQLLRFINGMRRRWRGRNGQELLPVPTFVAPKKQVAA